MRKVMMRRADAPIWQEVERRCIRCVMDFAWQILVGQSGSWMRIRASSSSARVHTAARHPDSRRISSISIAIAYRIRRHVFVRRCCGNAVNLGDFQLRARNCLFAMQAGGDISVASTTQSLEGGGCNQYGITPVDRVAVLYVVAPA